MDRHPHACKSLRVFARASLPSSTCFEDNTMVVMSELPLLRNVRAFGARVSQNFACRLEAKRPKRRSPQFFHFATAHIESPFVV